MNNDAPATSDGLMRRDICAVVKLVMPQSLHHAEKEYEYDIDNSESEQELLHSST